MASFCEGCPNAHLGMGDIETVQTTPICGDKFPGLGYAARVTDETGMRSHEFYWGGVGNEPDPQDLVDAVEACKGPVTKGWLNRVVVCGAPGILPIEESYARDLHIPKKAIVDALHAVPAQRVAPSNSESSQY